MSNEPKDVFVLERVLAAPVATVWRTWTEPALLARWYKPNPKCETTVVEHDLSVGGVMLYDMSFGGPVPHRERWEFVAIDAPSRLQWLHSIVDQEGNVAANPQMPDWPASMMTTIELEEHAEGTLQRLTWAPNKATAAELTCFRNASAFLDRGWVAGFNSLEAFLAEHADTI